MKKLKMVIPKGRIFEKVASLLGDIGIKINGGDRLYIPQSNDCELEIKIMKPQNIAQLIELGSHDIGFTGFDWITETNSQVEELLDLKLDPVKLVAAIPSILHGEDLKQRKIIVASEYENISRKFLEENEYDYFFIRSFGATEAFPPQDADMIIDNSASGQTLKDHNLVVTSIIMESSTRLIAHESSLRDQWKREKIEELVMLLEAVLNARSRVMLEMNVTAKMLDEIVDILPCMRAPTVSALYNGQGYAVKVAVHKTATRKLIPKLKKIGATDILEYEFKKVMA